MAPQVSQRPLEAIVLAGGKGTRLRDVVSDVPKPMAPIRGRPFLEYLLSYWVRQGIERFIISIGYMGETIRAHFGECFEGADIEYSSEGVPLGTGGGTALATLKLRGPSPWLLLNGDSFFEVPLDDMSRFHRVHRGLVTMALTPVQNGLRYGGVGVDGDGKIIRFEEKKEGASLINGGVYLIGAEAVRFLSKEGAFSLESDVFPALLSSGATMYGYLTQGRFIDIGVPDDYMKAKEILSFVGI